MFGILDGEVKYCGIFEGVGCCVEGWGVCVGIFFGVFMDGFGDGGSVIVVESFNDVEFFDGWFKGGVFV